MRICLYTGSALPKLGGQEAVVDALARQFLLMGHQPVVLAPRPRLPLLSDDASLPYPVIRHPRFFSTKHFVSWYQVFLLRAMRRCAFDVVHCHDVYPTGYVSSLCQSRIGIPLVITSHGGDVRQGNARLSKPGMQPRFIQAIQSADALISIGKFTTDGFLQLGADPAKINLIPNGVDLQPFAKPASRPTDLDPKIVPEKYLLFLGRLSHRKGIDVLLSALALLPATGLVELVIGGSGDERPNLEKQITSLNLQSRVRLVGRVTGDEKTYLLQNALAIVVPSRGWEAFPLVVLEGYAAGRPVLGSRIAGLEDVVRENKTGLLVTSESPADWADAIKKVRDDSDWLRQAGGIATSLAKEFSWDQIATRHFQLYTKLTQRKAPGSSEPGA